MKQYGAEFFGTFWLVLGGCGSAVLSAAFPDVGIGLLGVSFAFGLTVLTMAYAIGHVSGCHLNPAVSIGLWAGGRFPADKLLGYIIAQCLGAIVAGGVLYLIASGKADFSLARRFCFQRLWRAFTWRIFFVSALVTEVVMTMMFLFIILSVTDKNAPQGFAGLAIGLDSDLDSFNLYSSDQYIRQSCKKSWRCNLCRRLGLSTALALLGCPYRRCIAGRANLSLCWQQ